MSPKAKGARNEHRSMAVLEKAGYQMTRAAGSLGIWDIIGYSSTDWVVCQVKTRDWPYGFEIQALRECKVPPNTRKLIHRWRDRQRLPDEKVL